MCTIIIGVCVTMVTTVTSYMCVCMCDPNYYYYYCCVCIAQGSDQRCGGVHYEENGSSG